MILKIKRKELEKSISLNFSGKQAVCEHIDKGQENRHGEPVTVFLNLLFVWNKPPFGLAYTH
jgi:hypothetical protein